MGNKIFIAIFYVICWNFQQQSQANLICDSSVQCTSSLEPEDCPPGTFYDPKATNGCCPGCRGGKSWGDSECNDKRPAKRCAPGLKCVNGNCVLDRENCFHTLHLDEEVGWKPLCEKDGTYAAKQCRGDRLTGRCFCYSKTGRKIFGSDWWNNADNMTCACSRQRDELEMSGRLDVSLHCLPNGNYEPLQCDSDMCWCAEETTGDVQIDTIAVTTHLMSYLPCYNRSFHGDIYLRKCESVSYAQRILMMAMINRGTSGVTMNLLPCGFDGSYGYYKIEGNLAFCQLPDGRKLSYSTPSKMLNEMDCNCAIDEELFKAAGIHFNLICNYVGNYEPIQSVNGKVFCVDKYGFAVSDVMDLYPGMDCNDYIYYAQEDFTEEIDDYF